jgi:DNA polymerase IIIc chi subunit
MAALSKLTIYPGHCMRAFILFVVSSLLLTACAAVDDSKKSITLDKALWQYETAIRWVDFGTANSMRRTEGTAVYSPDPGMLKNIKVTSYEVMNTTTSADHSEVNMTVEIVYYHDERMKLETLTDHQTWKYDPEIKAWYITTPLPAFK